MRPTRRYALYGANRDPELSGPLAHTASTTVAQRWVRDGGAAIDLSTGLPVEVTA